MIAQIITGNANLRAGSIQIMAFFRPSASSEEQPLHTAIKDPKAEVKMQGHAVNIPASDKSNKLGFWVQGNYYIPNSSFMKLFIKRHVKSTGAQLPIPRMHQLMLYFADSAPLRSLDIDLITATDATIEKASITGRFVVVDPEDFEEHGISLGQFGNMIHTFDRDEWEIFITDTVKESGKDRVTKPKLEKNERGGIIKKSRSNRRVIRRRK